jgi:hypothetical protein
MKTMWALVTAAILGLVLSACGPTTWSDDEVYAIRMAGNNAYEIAIEQGASEAVAQQAAASARATKQAELAVQNDVAGETALTLARAYFPGSEWAIGLGALLFRKVRDGLSGFGSRVAQGRPVAATKSLLTIPGIVHSGDVDKPGLQGIFKAPPPEPAP